MSEELQLPLVETMYAPGALRERIRQILDGKTSECPMNVPHGLISMEEALYRLVARTAITAHSGGRREVQQGIIRVLDLRQLL